MSLTSDMDDREEGRGSEPSSPWQAPPHTHTAGPGSGSMGEGFLAGLTWPPAPGRAPNSQQRCLIDRLKIK